MPASPFLVLVAEKICMMNTLIKAEINFIFKFIFIQLLENFNIFAFVLQKHKGVV